VQGDIRPKERKKEKEMWRLNKHSLVMHTHDGTANNLLHEIPSESLQQVLFNWHLHTLNGKFLTRCLPAITAAVLGSLCMSVPFISDLHSAINV